jgi:hypothetical protein
MAIDTRQKRASAMTVCTCWYPPAVQPDGSFDQADRQNIGWSYTGILAGGPPVSAISQMEPWHRRRRRKPDEDL